MEQEVKGHRVVVRDVPDALYAELKIQAVRHRLTLSQLATWALEQGITTLPRYTAFGPKHELIEVNDGKL